METGSPGDPWSASIAYLVSSRQKKDPDTKSKWPKTGEREKELSSGLLDIYMHTCVYVPTCLYTQESMDSIFNTPEDHAGVKSLELNGNTFRKQILAIMRKYWLQQHFRKELP